MERRSFLKCAAGIAGAFAAAPAFAGSVKDTNIAASSAVASSAAKKQIGLQTYSLGADLLKDLPGGLKRLHQMGYTDLEIFGYNGETGKFGTYSRENTIFVDPKDYKKMADDAGLKISGSHLTPAIREYNKENMPKFEEFWKKAADIHVQLGVRNMVQPSLPQIKDTDDAKRVCEIFNKAGEISKSAGILWGYHNHSGEFRKVTNPGETLVERGPKANGEYIEKLFLDNTDPALVMFELDVYWAVMGQQDPVEWITDYSGRYKLLHIKDRWIIGDSGMMNFENIFNAGYQNGVIGFYTELESDRKGRTQFEGVEASARYLLKAPFVK